MKFIKLALLNLFTPSESDMALESSFGASFGPYCTPFGKNLQQFKFTKFHNPTLL